VTFFFNSHVLFSADTGLLCGNILVMCCYPLQHPRPTDPKTWKLPVVNGLTYDAIQLIHICPLEPDS
jgi:hypothetical protein